DPTADAAALLRRIGFGTLTLALPVAALVSRRAGVVLAPLGVALIIAAMVIDNPSGFMRNLRDAMFSRAGLLLVGLTGWVILAATWSPWKADAVEKALNIGFAVALGIAGAAALPSRMRASNLNLIALGVGTACLLAVVLGLTEFMGRAASDADGGAIARGLALVSVMAWPALAWLLSRGRSYAAIALALLVILVALMRFGQGGAVTIIVGIVAFGLVSWNRRLGARLLGGVSAGLMLLAPLLPFVLSLFSSLFSANWARGIEVAGDVVRYQPVKLITGHGLDSVLRGKLAGVLPTDAPTTILFETWYELGLVGAVAAALCLWFAIRAAARMTGPLAAGGVAAYVTAFALAVMGQATLQFWWLVMLSAVAIMFTAIARGQVRTERPIAPAWFGKAKEQ
ncbi:MAG: peptide ABC transporter permease, partial [Bosea sp. (in: a-proteobacteria)]